jgi:hypothetical protein
MIGRHEGENAKTNQSFGNTVWEYHGFFLLRTEWGYGGNILWEDGNVMEHHGIYKQPCSFEFNKPEMDGIVHFVAIP